MSSCRARVQPTGGWSPKPNHPPPPPPSLAWTVAQRVERTAGATNTRPFSRTKDQNRQTKPKKNTSISLSLVWFVCESEASHLSYGSYHIIFFMGQVKHCKSVHLGRHFIVVFVFPLKSQLFCHICLSIPFCSKESNNTKFSSVCR